MLYLDYLLNISPFVIRMDCQRKVRIYEQLYGQKTMRFGTQELKQYTRHKEQFYFEARQQLDQIQNCLIGNVWNIPTILGIATYKIAVINALANYFLTTVRKPDDKKFSCYAILSGPQTGVYATWEEIKTGILGSGKSTSYKGKTNYFISTLLKGKQTEKFSSPDKT